MSKTTLLPTVTAVRWVWAMTGKFSNDESSRTSALYVEDTLSQIEKEAQETTIPEEKSYVTAAVATMKSSLRNMEIAYKGRTLNFDENEKLREAYLESVTESVSFGKSAKDFLTSLPAMTIGGASGITVVQALIPDISGVALWAIGLAASAAGYLVNLWFVGRSRQIKQKLYVLQDYERGLYYEQYLSRARESLFGLFQDLERIHKQVFQENYETDTDPSKVWGKIDNILAGAHSTWCPYVHQHMKDKKVVPENWTLCESGNSEAIRKCQFWKDMREPISANIS